MNSAQLSAKARRAMRRREEEIEADEMESGELNLIPYLDIVTNVMIFLLASLTTGLFLGHINTSLPDHAPAGAVSPDDPNKDPEKEGVQLVVSVTRNECIMWSLSGLEGTVTQPKVRIPRLPPGTDAKGNPTPAFDYEKLTAAAKEIVMRRWPPGKGERPTPTYSVILQADNDTPYDVVIAVMDHLRSTPPPADPKAPKPDEGLPLFPDIHFSLGFE